MFRLTAVAYKEKDGAGNNNSSETGIFATHSPTKTKTYYKNKNSNIFFLNNYTKALLSMLYISLCFTPTSATNFVAKSPPAPHECGSMDFRNDCTQFYKLQNCTVITGFLDITYIPSPDVKCNFSEYRFENLREITDFLIIHQVKTITSFKDLFPNLTVIRGRRLFINHALIIVTNPMLEKIEFKSLIAIERGHVLIDDVPNVCFAKKINWARLTLRPGTNVVYLNETADCPGEAKCIGCKSDYCWSDDVCQKFENDSVISLVQDPKDCHEQCFGGCYNSTAQGCVVCKGYTDHGTCVETCPNNLYASSHYLRCYTRKECLDKNQYIFKNTCVDSCPVGYEINNITRRCEACTLIKKCRKVCNGSEYDNSIDISTIMQLEKLRNCEILNATVTISISQLIDFEELEDILKDVKEITGYLKIDNSPHFTSLNFLKNLEKIHGRTVVNSSYALIIYNNKKLKELWDVKPQFKIVNGGMYIHRNDKLCNHLITQFRLDTFHDNSRDSYQINDQDVLCAPATLNMIVQVVDHATILVAWPKDQTFSEVEIIYRPLADKQQLHEEDEIDTEVCNRKAWRRELIFVHDLRIRDSNYEYLVYNLTPYTRYAILVKTFSGEDDSLEARSEIKYVTTKIDIPAAPKLSLISKTFDSLDVNFFVDKDIHVGTQIVDYYMLAVYEIPDDKEILDTRDYCDVNIKIRLGDNDYDDCCSRRERERADEQFISRLQQEFGCSRDQSYYCHDPIETDIKKKREMVMYKRLEPWQDGHVIRPLKPNHLYTLQVKACNSLGCSSYGMLSTRTNYSTAADKVDSPYACKMADKNEYRVYFSEPRLVNGYIHSYLLYFRFQDTVKGELSKQNVKCVTRLQHERNNNIFVIQLDKVYNEFGIAAQSFETSGWVGWLQITTCKNTTRFSAGFVILITFILIGVVGIFICIAYLRGYYTQIWRNYLHRRRVRPETRQSGEASNLSAPEEFQMAGVGSEMVRFVNNPDDHNEDEDEAVNI